MKLFLLLLLALPTLALAQATPAATPTTTNGLWKCQLPGGTYEVAIRAILSVSSHEYVVDGLARVTEVNIDTTGATVVRFYYIEPAAPTAITGLGGGTAASAAQLLNDAAARTGTDAWQKVVKSYPLTTHAHTVEYRLSSKDDLAALFTSVETAFRTQKPSVYVPATQ